MYRKNVNRKKVSLSHIMLSMNFCSDEDLVLLCTWILMFTLCVLCIFPLSINENRFVFYVLFIIKASQNIPYIIIIFNLYVKRLIKMKKTRVSVQFLNSHSTFLLCFAFMAFMYFIYFIYFVQICKYMWASRLDVNIMLVRKSISE